MRINARACKLKLAYPWKIASTENAAANWTVIVELANGDGLHAWGEAAPSLLYGESAENTLHALSQLDARRLAFAGLPESMAYLDSIPRLPVAAKCAINLALLDGAAKLQRKPLHDFLGLGFREHHHLTSFSIGIDSPEMIREKVREAAPYPVLKLKVGDPGDRENLAALRSVAPRKPVRVDANEGWKSKEEALRMIEWLAATDAQVQFVEQPMPRDAREADLRWLKERSPLPVFADESCHTVKDIPRCAGCFHGVNVKLIKTGGVTMARETLAAARKAGLQTMIGCMIETSAQISAAAHLAELADYLDIDGSLLITNDPFVGVTAEQGILSFQSAPEPFGLRVSPRDSAPH